MQAREIVICAPVRTPIGAYNGSLKTVPATALGAAVVRETLRRSAIDPAAVDTVVMGNVVQAGNRMNPARQAAIGGGMPVSVPALTVNRVCGSGAQAIVSVALEIWAGQARLGIAGGMENMDMAPYLMPNGRWGARMGDVTAHDSMLRDGLVDAFSGEHSGWHTEDLVARYALTRLEQDEWSERSQRRFGLAQQEGLFESEVVAVDVPGARKQPRFERDEANRPDTTVAALSALRPAFRADGTITAGNAPGLNSGAAAMVIADAAMARDQGLQPLGRLVSYGIAAVEPGMFGLGPVPAIRMALQRAGWTLSEVDRFEINEAFAAVPLAVARELGISHDVLNVDGGAIAHGHPIGATGAILVTRMLHAMQRQRLQRGVVSLCIGGGQGIALALEAC
ncbi:thiolase family protein [Bordetella flabilis]|uniref:Acetyl-CoA acetyltransferase n=1 Tax=Bordetella flabilis TaxID=463014 RepID=A0A193G8F9_9BORD|nr:thiolase family protein [Bordetella flabilis]ANN76115.1 acetyl-CoA acetyltransferase [Bordetella flabilis]